MEELKACRAERDSRVLQDEYDSVVADLAYHRDEFDKVGCCSLCLPLSLCVWYCFFFFFLFSIHISYFFFFFSCYVTIRFFDKLLCFHVQKGSHV